MTPDQKRKLEEMAKDKRKHFQVLGTLTGVDSKLLIAAYEEGHSAGAQAACEMATQEERKRCAKLVSIAKSVEQFRANLADQIRMARSYSVNFRLAERFGLIKVEDKPIRFYFESAPKPEGGSSG